MADTIFDNNAGAIDGIDARWIKASSGKTILSSAQDASYSLDATDTADYFKLTVSRSSNVIIKLESQGGDANISLLGFDGTTQSNSVGSSNNNTTGLADVIISDSSVPLQAGQEYYIRVNALNPTTTINYTLTIDTLPTSRSDILWRDYASADFGGGGNYIWYMNNTELVDVTFPRGVSPNYQLVAAVDFNKDGNPDYVFRDANSGINAIWLMDAAGLDLIGYVPLPSVADPNWRITGATDINKDGNTDLTWQYTPTNLAVVWMLDAQQQLANYIEAESPAQANVLLSVVQGFETSTTTAILNRDYSTGSNSIWQVNTQGRFVSALSINSIDPTWAFAGTADFNGDGNLDFFWRNYITGENQIWYMNQTQFLSSAAVQPVDTRYQIASILSNVAPVDLAGNTSAAAFNIGKLDGTAQYNDQVGGKDRTDYYSFTLDVASKMDIAAIGSALSATTSFQVETADGTLVSSVSTANGADQQKLTDITLDPGTYFVRLQSTSTTAIDYAITIGASAKLPVNLFPVAPLALKNTNGTPISIGQAVSVKDPFPFVLDYIVKYTGRPTNSFKVGFFLSADATISTSDYRFDINSDGLQNANDVATVTGLAPDTNGNRTQGLTLPSKDNSFWDQNGDGTYYIGIIVDPDNEIVELDPQGNSKENDNALGTSILVKDARLPDLTGSGFNVSQSSAVRGSTVTVSGSVLNIGKAASDTQNPLGSEFDVGFYLSRDNVFSSDDLELTFATFAPISAGGQIAFNSTTNTNPIQRPYFDAPVVLPTNWAGYQQGDGIYYVLMKVDPGTTVKEVSGGILNNVTADAIFIDV